MPDGSGFLYSTVNELRESSNIYRYDLATGRTTQVTKLDKEFAREFSISVDGSSVVFERCTAADDDTGCDLWTAGTDGSGARLVVKNGLHPAWNR
jgi:Tol biopolymer transport system component